MSEDLKPAVGRESDKFMLRLPEGMRDRIAELAKQNNRSMNAEIVARLEQTFTGQVDTQAITALAYRMAQLEIQHEFRRIELTQLATKLLTVLTLVESVSDFGEGVVSPEELKKWYDDASQYRGLMDELATSVEEKIGNLRALAATVHNVDAKGRGVMGAKPSKAVKRISRKATSKGSADSDDPSSAKGG